MPEVESDILAQPITPSAALQAGLPPAAAYQASSLVVRLSLKIFNCTPGELPQGLRDQLCGWLCATPAGAEGYIRPGCVHLTVMVGSLCRPHCQALGCLLYAEWLQK